MRRCPKCERTYPDDRDVCPLDGSSLPAAAEPTHAELTESLTRRYRIVKRLGEGGMGTVFLAEQIAVGNRPVALKVLLRKLLDDPEFLLRFRNEAASAGRIRHPNVVTIYESGQTDDGTPFIAMEYLEGETLYQALQKRGAIPLGECVDILQQAARGLNAAHKLGIVHRDLKPENIFLLRSEEGEPLVKVVDFGIAKLLDTSSHRTLTGMVLGTPAYMSAEHAAGMRGDELDARSDVYSLGVVTYEMLTGRVPFHSETPLGYIRKHVSEPPPSLRAVRADLHVPPQLEKVIMKALEKDRDKRYASTLEFAREFAEAARAPRGAEAPATVSQVREPPQKPGRETARGHSLPSPSPDRTGTAVQTPPGFLVRPSQPQQKPKEVIPTRGGMHTAATAPPPVQLPRPPGSAADIAATLSKRARQQPLLSPLNTIVIATGLVLLAVAGTLWYRSGNLPAGMLYIPGGTFMMGCDKDQEPTASPPHAVIVAPFYLDKTPVTNAEYLEFIRATRHAFPSGWTQASYPAGQENWPVTGVSWDDAQAYAKWKGKRLPTEAEWEFAARGRDGRLYPWGSQFNPTLTNSGERALQHPEPVGSHLEAASPFGVLDTSGNVWQWCQDGYRLYPGNKMKFDVPANAKVIRGGSFASDRNHVTTTTRNLDLPTSRSSEIGFRCAK